MSGKTAHAVLPLNRTQTIRATTQLKKPAAKRRRLKIRRQKVPPDSTLVTKMYLGELVGGLWGT
jgi:hypothetical protein